MARALQLVPYFLVSSVLRDKIQCHHCMKKYLLVLLFTGACFSCNQKKHARGEEEAINIHAFINYFKPIKLPYEFSDTILAHHKNDSLLKNKEVEQFVPDSVFSTHFGKSVKPRFYALGRVSVKKNETYLFLKAISPVKKMAYVICFDKSNKFITELPLMNVSAESDPSVKYLAGMDTKYTISVTRQRKTTDGQIFYKRSAYVFNDAGVFTLILTESNEAKPKNTQVLNPIDTLAHKHKFSGDYVQDKRNIISVRDGKNSSYAVVFVHFEKDNGECKGELKGEAKFTSATTARYRSNGDPCQVDFSFTANGVRMKEVEGCGNHRDIKCFFDGFYARKKEAKPKPAKKKSR